ncbi:MAG: PilN family type IVB pilus formation outer membrane protein [Sulfuritalea sp.]|nr:PilN family type IVB pilus formation outer membrane protein [Sulfuritalea sp.]
MKNPLATLFCALTLGACSSAMVAPIQKDVLAVDAEVGKSLNQLARNQRQVPDASVVAPANLVKRDTGVWLPVRKVREGEGTPSGNVLGKRQIAINREFRSTQEVAERVTQLTGIPVIVSPDASITSAALPGATSTTTGAPGATPGPAGMPSMPPPIPGTQAAGAAGAPVSLSYSGTLAGFLDIVVARFGVSWEWQGDRIRLYRYVTKTFTLTALPGDTTTLSTISNQSGGSGSGGANSASNTSTSSSQQTGVAFSGLSVWKAIDEALKTIVSSAGKVTVAAATGTVTVTDTPQIVAIAERYVDELNVMLSRQVVVNVRVLSVELNNADQYGINWDAVFNSLSGNFGFTFKNAFAVDAAASNLALKVLGTAGAATTGSPDMKAWSGSSAIISALSSQGHVSQVTSATIPTLNNQPAPLQVGKQTSYLASSMTTIATGVGATTTLQPGLITTGFSMNLVPHILDKGKLLLQYTINISSLTGIDTVTSGGSSIQTPKIDTRDFLQRVMLNSGDTMVMAGFEQTSLNATTQGMGSPDNVMLGGGVKGSRARSVLVILIQPVISEG